MIMVTFLKINCTFLEDNFDRLNNIEARIKIGNLLTNITMPHILINEQQIESPGPQI
jgi:hypothetical protein